MDLSSRISYLRIGPDPLPGLQAPDSLIKMIEPRIASFYQDTEIYPIAPEAIDYLSGLATRYACWTLPRRLHLQERGVEGYALWLSLVWLIDALFDQDRSMTSEEDAADLLLTITRLEEVEGSSPLFTSLFKTVRRAYSKYLDLTAEYRELNPGAYDQILIWFVRYLATLTDSSETQRNLIEYAHWRLVSGAMMCVVWHLCLFTSTELSPGSSLLFELVSLIVSYHNDLLSFHRDRDQGTPNLLDSLDGNSWTRMKKGIELVDRLYSQVGQILEEAGDENVSEIALAILEGSYNWALNEPRYSHGLKILMAAQTGDRELFEQLLEKKERVSGDLDFE